MQTCDNCREKIGIKSFRFQYHKCQDPTHIVTVEELYFCQDCLAYGQEIKDKNILTKGKCYDYGNAFSCGLICCCGCLIYGSRRSNIAKLKCSDSMKERLLEENDAPCNCCH